MSNTHATDVDESEDNAVIYHRVSPSEGLIESANTIWGLIQEMYEKFPEKNLILALDIDGHRTTLPDDGTNEDAEPGYDREMVVLMQEVCMEMFRPFLHQFISPLGTATFNPNQRELPAKYTPSTCELFIDLVEDGEEWEIAIYDPDEETPPRR